MNLLIVGANGLVGQAVLEAALAAPDVQVIRTLTRQALSSVSPRVQSLVLARYDEAHLAQLDLHGLDACIHCAGVLPIGLGEAAYRRITVDVTLCVARAFAQSNPEGRFVYVSGAGAHAASRLMPLRVKGQAEDELLRCHPNSVLLRPGIVAPTGAVRSPHALRQKAYALGATALALAARLAPQAVITSDTLGRAAIAACRSNVAAGVLDGRALQQHGRDTLARGR